MDDDALKKEFEEWKKKKAAEEDAREFDDQEIARLRREKRAEWREKDSSTLPNSEQPPSQPKDGKGGDEPKKPRKFLI